MKDFFIISNDNKDAIQDALLGFVVSPNGIFDSENFAMLKDDDVIGNGAYILIRRIEDVISIKQDFNGSWGLYYYQEDENFAISNSVLMLMDYLKDKTTITLNRDYANNLLTNSLCTRAFSETIISEIQLIEKNKEVLIHENGELEFCVVDYEENTVALDSCEGMMILDAWYQKWIDILTGLKKEEAQISTDLSGGFDSRMTLALFIGSKIDWDGVRINSYMDGLHTHEEDYQIASRISNDYGFRLNDSGFSEDAYFFSTEELLEKSFYTKLTVHKEFFFQDRKYRKKRYKVTGDGGEAIRAKWNYDRKSFINMESSPAKRYSKQVADELRDSNTRILTAGYDYINENYHVDADSVDGTLALYKDTWNRSHFGKNAVESFFSNVYRLQPLIDPDLYRLKTNSPDCEDRDLLMALIFVRYCPGLLDYEIQGNRMINPETVSCAKEISDRYTRSDCKKMYDQAEFLVSSAEKADLAWNIDRGASRTVYELISSICHQQNGRLKKVFCSAFSEELYNYATIHMNSNRYVPFRQFFAIIGISWAMLRTEGHWELQHRTLWEDLSYLNCEESSEIRFPYDKVKKGSRIILYGAGSKGAVYKKQIDASAYCEIVKWVDKRYQQMGNGIEDISCISEAKFDCIVVAIFNETDREEAIREICGMGVDENKIVY
ncbi:MAG: hypothetical protein K6F53_09425 [Lachnospiraceae bacterium]|nr:hypothetical protein [Lachnospiraceae bacterium]